MDISWYGLSCFRLREGNTTILCDPYDKSVGSLSKIKADIVTISHDKPGHNDVSRAQGDPRILTGPGEYEINDVFIIGMASFHDKPENGETPERNVAYFFDIGGISVGHLGDMGQVPKKSHLDELQVGEVDVLLIPVGGGDTLDATRAVEVVGMLEPRILIPMHYQQSGLKAKWVSDLDPVDKFMKELGIAEPETESNLRIAKSSLPEETQVVLLEPVG